MTNRNIAIHIAIWMTFVLFALASLLSDNLIWGLNSLLYIPSSSLAILSTVGLLMLSMYFVPVDKWLSQESIDRVGELLFSEKRLYRHAIALALVAVAWFFRTETHFLGDGYTWIQNFSLPDKLIHKWTEPLASLFVRSIQLAFGEINKTSALHAFQTISLLSGYIFFINIVAIVKMLVKPTITQLFALTTILMSGVALLFFGYVEYYPILWAATTLFIRSVLAHIGGAARAIRPLLTFALMVSIHLQSLYLLPMLLIGLIWNGNLNVMTRRKTVRLMFSMSVLGVVLALLFSGWLSKTSLSLHGLFLPLFSGGSDGNSYAALSSKHLFDIVNLNFLLYPGVIIVLASLIGLNRKVLRDAKFILLLFSTVGPLLFLLLINPVIGMGRDWDLMSLTLLLPILALLRLHTLGSYVIPLRTLLIYSILCLSICSSFLLVSTQASFSEQRIHSLLKYYGSYDRSGWTIYANYFHERDDFTRVLSIKSEMKALFPEDKLVDRTLQHLAKGAVDSALTIAQRLFHQNPYSVVFTQLLGNVYSAIGLIDSGFYYYNRALVLSPHLANLKTKIAELHLRRRNYKEALPLLQDAVASAPTRADYIEGLGIAHLKLGQLDSVVYYRNRLFAMDQNSPNYHMLALLVAEAKSDSASVVSHRESYLKYGKSHPAYQSVVRHYSKPE